MKTNSKSEAALLWDESFLWGLMAYRALRANNMPFQLVRSKDVQEGRLKNYNVLFVPGGWASQKIKALGDRGTDEIRRFVNGGGSYVGFCGGAGLATKDGIGLLNVERKPTKERVPSFNGRIELDMVEHPIWKGIHLVRNVLPVFHAWWPSQFLIPPPSPLSQTIRSSPLYQRGARGDSVAEGGGKDCQPKTVKRNSATNGPTIRILARYGNALPDSFSSDVNVGDANEAGRWPELETRYRINLDPALLKDEPAVVEGSFGKGRVLLSLIHFDTPDDQNGMRVLRNLWHYLGANTLPFSMPASKAPSHDLKGPVEKQEGCISELISEIETAVTELIDLGLRNFLWFRRNSMLLQWRRGVRGMEYCTLHQMIRELCARLREGRDNRDRRGEKSMLEIRALLVPFVEKAKQLLLLERYAMQDGQVTYDKCDVPQIQRLRVELFSDSKSYGGLFKKLIDRVDSLLYSLIIEQQNGD